ncbi:histidine-type phosphatase, partial [archaeon]
MYNSAVLSTASFVSDNTPTRAKHHDSEIERMVRSQYEEHVSSVPAQASTTAAAPAAATDAAGGMRVGAVLTADGVPTPAPAGGSSFTPANASVASAAASLDAAGSLASMRVHSATRERLNSVELRCSSETLWLMSERWKKLWRDLYNPKKQRYDLSKIPDVYDQVKYDCLHNSNLNLTPLQELYHLAKAFADVVVTQEYGISVAEKKEIASRICHHLLRKIFFDMTAVAAPEEPEPAALAARAASADTTTAAAVAPLTSTNRRPPPPGTPATVVPLSSHTPASSAGSKSDASLLAASGAVAAGGSPRLTTPCGSVATGLDTVLERSPPVSDVSSESDVPPRGTESAPATAMDAGGDVPSLVSALQGVRVVESSATAAGAEAGTTAPAPSPTGTQLAAAPAVGMCTPPTNDIAASTAAPAGAAAAAGTLCTPELRQSIQRGVSSDPFASPLSGLVVTLRRQHSNAAHPRRKSAFAVLRTGMSQDARVVEEDDHLINFAIGPAFLPGSQVPIPGFARTWLPFSRLSRVAAPTSAADDVLAYEDAPAVGPVLVPGISLRARAADKSLE